MSIRKVTEQDLPKLIWQGLEEWKEVINKDFNDRIKRKLIWLVVEIHGEIVGQVIAQMKDKFEKPNIFALRVREAHQRKGLGTKLINHAEEELYKLGAQYVTISVDQGNEALELYERLGYRKIGEVRNEHWVRTYNGQIIEEDISLIDLEKPLKNL